MGQGQGERGSFLCAKSGDLVHPAGDIGEPRGHRIAASIHMVDGRRGGRLELLELSGQD